MPKNLPATVSSPIHDEIDASQRGLYLKLHSAAIHIENSMSLLARKCWLHMLLNAYHDLPSKELYQITLKELKDHVGESKTRNNKHIIETLRELRKKDVTFNIFGKDGKTEWAGCTSLISEFRVSTEKAGVLLYAFPPFLREHLYQPSVYAKLNLAISKLFRSKHALAIYMFAVDYIYRDRNEGSKNLSIGDLRRYLGLEESQYRLGGDMVRLMTSVAKEINEESNIDISIIPEKAGRKIVGFKFKMGYKPDALPVEPQTLLPAISVEFEAPPKVVELRFAALEAFAELYDIDLDNPTLELHLRALAQAYAFEDYQAYLELVIKDIQRRLKKPNADGIQSVPGIFVHYLNKRLLKGRFERNKDKLVQKKQARQAEYQDQLEKLLRDLFIKEQEQAFKTYVANQAQQGLLTDDAFEAELKASLPAQFLKQYLRRFQGKLTTKLLLEAPLAAQQLLGAGAIFGFVFPDEPVWREQYLRSGDGLALIEQLEQAPKPKRRAVV